ncbi:hypothetical protein D3C71_20770 [compost metagenome]
MLSYPVPGALHAPALLSPQECLSLIELAERAGYEAATVRLAAGEASMPQVRNNGRCIVEAPGWTTLLWQRLSALPLAALGGGSPMGLPRALRFYRYRPGQRFKMHRDGPWAEGGLTSRLTALFYLNEGFEGGDTAFREARVQPACGDALVFVHSLWHEGAEVRAGEKLVLRSDVLFAPAQAPGR